jgi:hypothetical protein
LSIGFGYVLFVALRHVSSIEFIQKFVELLQSEMAVELTIQLDDRSYRTCPEARHADHAETSVRGVAVIPQFEAPLEVLGERQALFDMARGAAADLDHMLAQRGEPELVVEGGDPVDPRHGGAEGGGHCGHRGLGYMAFSGLYLLEEGDQVVASQLAPLCLAPLLDDLAHGIQG